jgi:hypothetical protein
MAAVTAQALIIWHQDHDTFASATADDLATIEPTIRDARGITISGTGNSYTVSVASAAADSGGGPFVIEHNPSGTVRSCDVPGRGGCPDDGHW